jgi:hypothetical protein
MSENAPQPSDFDADAVLNVADGQFAVSHILKKVLFLSCLRHQPARSASAAIQMQAAARKS